MTLIQLLFVEVILGVCLWLFNAYVTAIDGRFKQIINVVVVIVGVLIAVTFFFPGIMGGLNYRPR